MDQHPKILFISPNSRKASGGIKQLYRQVDILNENNFNAYIVTKSNKKRINWFSQNTKTLTSNSIYREIRFLEIKKKWKASKKLKYKFKYVFFKLINNFLKLFKNNIAENDILVFPEIFGPIINKIKPNNRRVIFNQNCYYTFNNYSINLSKTNNSYTSSHNIGTVVASRDAFNYLSYAFPSINLFRIRLGIDHNVFSLGTEKKKQIAFMPRKLHDDVVQVINILKLRESLIGWNLIEVDNMTELEVAKILKESAIFLSFNHREGFGLPPVEAMACGCNVIGYVGRGGEEYFDKQFTDPVNERDIITFVKKIEKTINDFNTTPEKVTARGIAASQFVLNEYSLKNEETDVISLWKNLLD